MRSGFLAALALALAAVAEVSWGIFFLDGFALQAALAFMAGGGLAIASFGHYVDASGRHAASVTGLAVAAGAHVGAIVLSWPLGPELKDVAEVGVALGLLLAAYATNRGEAGLKLAKFGLALASVSALLWIPADIVAGHKAYVLGDVLATVGWGLAAAFAGEAHEIPEP